MWPLLKAAVRGLPSAARSCSLFQLFCSYRPPTAFNIQETFPFISQADVLITRRGKRDWAALYRNACECPRTGVDPDCVRARSRSQRQVRGRGRITKCIGNGVDGRRSRQSSESTAAAGHRERHGHVRKWTACAVGHQHRKRKGESRSVSCCLIGPASCKQLPADGRDVKRHPAGVIAHTGVLNQKVQRGRRSQRKCISKIDSATLACSGCLCCEYWTQTGIR